MTAAGRPARLSEALPLVSLGPALETFELLLLGKITLLRRQCSRRSDAFVRFVRELLRLSALRGVKLHLKLNRWPEANATLCVSGQILREYLTVATRPADRNGLGLKPAEAAANVRAIQDRTTLLAEDARVTERLLRLCDDVQFAGRQVHDANVVATMLVHGVGTVVTMNAGDFERFGGYISVLSL